MIRMQRHSQMFCRYFCATVVHTSPKHSMSKTGTQYYGQKRCTIRGAGATGAARGQEFALLLRTALQNMRAIDINVY